MKISNWVSLENKIISEAGEELFAHYGYQKAEFPRDVPWYFEQKLALEREERFENEKKKKYQKKKGKKKEIEKKKNCTTEKTHSNKK